MLISTKTDVSGTIHTCRSYVHTWFHERHIWHLRQRISMVRFVCGWEWPACSPIHPILGFWGSKVYKNGRFPALHADEPPRKIWRC